MIEILIGIFLIFLLTIIVLFLYCAMVLSALEDEMNKKEDKDEK